MDNTRRQFVAALGAVSAASVAAADDRDPCPGPSPAELRVTVQNPRGDLQEFMEEHPDMAAAVARRTAIVANGLDLPEMLTESSYYPPHRVLRITITRVC